MMDRRRALMAAQEPNTPILPGEYQQVEWLENTSTITSGVYNSFNTKISATYDTELGIDVQYIDGGRNILTCSPTSSGNTSMFGLMVFSGGTLGFGFFGNWIYGIEKDNNFHRYLLANGVATIDGTDVGGVSVQSGATSKYIKFFSENRSTEFNACHQRIKFAYIKQAGVLVGEYYPCYRIADGVLGFYNTIDNSFITKTGTGTITKGADV